MDVALPKTIHGKPVTQNEFRRAICEAIAVMESGGRVSDLLPILGPEWDSLAGRKLIAQTLGNLARRQSLVRDPHVKGVYIIAPGFKRRGVSPSDLDEDSIVDFIREQGGFARHRDIMEHLGLRAHGQELSEARARKRRRFYGTDSNADAKLSDSDVRSSADYNRVQKVLSTSSKIRQDYIVMGKDGRPTTEGWYCLPLDQLNQMTLRGRFMALIVRSNHEDLCLPGTFITERDRVFTRIGDVFRTAREARGLTLEDMVDHKQVAPALHALARIPLVRRDRRQNFMDETASSVCDMRENGTSPEEVAAYRDGRDFDHEDARGLAQMLDAFEDGGDCLSGPNLHLSAPVSFYTALAAALGIDAVMASRGVLQIDTRGERIRVERPRPDWEVVWQREAWREDLRDGLLGQSTFHEPEDAI